MSDNKDGSHITTEIIPEIHNTVSLQVYLRTEDGEPIPNQEITYNLSRLSGYKSSSYTKITDEEGKAHLILNITDDMYFEVVYEGNEKYEKSKITTLRVKPSKKEKDEKKNHLYQVNKQIEKEEIKKELSERRIDAYNQKQKEYEANEPDNIAIELKNVSLSFKVGNDKIDNLKEYVIRTINRTKEKKTIFKATDNMSFKIYKG